MHAREQELHNQIPLRPPSQSRQCVKLLRSVLHLSLGMAGPCERIIAVDTHSYVDTGGPVALAQLTTALIAAASNLTGFCVQSLNTSPLAWPRWMGANPQTFMGGSPALESVHPVLARSYPALASLPAVNAAALRSGDVLILTEYPWTESRCPTALLQRGVEVHIYLLSARTTTSLNRVWAQNGCRFLAHNHQLRSSDGANVSEGGSAVTFPLMRPYIDGGIVRRCAEHMRSSTAQDSRDSHSRRIVLIDDDTPRSIIRAVRMGCKSLHCEPLIVRQLNHSWVEELTREAAIAVDDCLVGTERLPVEAVLCGASLLTRRCRSGPHSQDFPIPTRNVLPAGLNASARATAYVSALARILRNQHREARDHAPLRDLYTNDVTAHSLLEEAREWLGQIARRQAQS